MTSTESQDTLPGDALKQLACQKEQEWREIQELRMHSLEAALKEKEKELRQEKSKLQKLKEDFKYNLRLLSERDAELEKYDSTLSQVEKGRVTKDAELSDLKIIIDDLKCSLAREVAAREQLQLHYQHRLREKQAELEHYKSAKDGEINQERQELESFKRNLQRQTRELEEELDIQRNELTAGFEEALKKREHEFRLQADEMSTQVLAHELKVKMLCKELEVSKITQQTTSKEFEEMDVSNRDLLKELKKKEWHIADLQAMKDSRISELEVKLQHTEQAMKRHQEDFERKYAEKDRYAKEKEAALNKIRQAGQDREQQFQKSIKDLQSQLEDSQVKMRQIEWSKQDLAKDKDTISERLESELRDLKSKWDAQLSEASRASVARDLEVQALRENDSKLKAELAHRKNDLDRYKSELNVGVEREAALERAKAQLDLDWQRRYEDVERTQYEKAEDLVKNLTKARDEALAALRESDREMAHKEDLIKVLSAERHKALETLKQHGLVLDRDIDISSCTDLPEASAERLQHLEQQNDQMRDVIRQMREQMEALGQHMPDTITTEAVRESRSKGYVVNLENELQKLKAKYRQLQQSQADIKRSEEEMEEQIPETAKESVLVRAHIEELNNTVGSLRSEKVELTAQLRKHQARILHLENMVNQLSKEPREKAVQLEQTEYELGAQRRRYETEVASLRQQVTSLELQLIEARKEADEYHKANIERNAENTALAQQLSALKIELAEGRPDINFGAQELLIQQLQDEICRLSRQDKEINPLTGNMLFNQAMKGENTAVNSTVRELQNKLHEAARYISQLAKEKQQLIEVGNRLRAKLKENGLRAPSPPGRPAFIPTAQTTQNQLQHRIQSKLSELEHLQYQVTKKELAAAKGGRKVQSLAHAHDLSPVTNQATKEPELQIEHDISKTWDRKEQSGKLTTVPEDAPLSARDRTELGDNPYVSRSAMSALSYHDNQMESSRGREPLLFSMSSTGGDSLQDIWKMLDEESSPRQHHTGDRVNAEDRPDSADSWTVRGSKTNPQVHPRTQVNKYASKTTKLKAAKKPKAQVRNWNVKTDQSFR